MNPHTRASNDQILFYVFIYEKEDNAFGVLTQKH